MDSHSTGSAVASAPVPATAAGYDATGAGSRVRPVVVVAAAVGLSAPCSHDVLVLVPSLLSLAVDQFVAVAASVVAGSASAVAVVGGVGEGGDLDRAPAHVLHSHVSVRMEAPAGDNCSLPEVVRLPWILLQDRHMKVALDVEPWWVQRNRVDQSRVYDMAHYCLGVQWAWWGDQQAKRGLSESEDNDLRVHVLQTGQTRLLMILRHGVDAEVVAVVVVGQRVDVAAKEVDEKRKRKEQRM